MTVFGNFVREKMKVLGKNQKDLAAELAVSPAYISQILSGKKNPPDLGRPRGRILLKKWSRYLQASEQDLLDMIRFDLYSVPLRPGARFPRMRELLCTHVHTKSGTVREEIRSMQLHPAENLAIGTMVEIYVVLQQEVRQGRAYGPERFKDFCRTVRSNREFVDRDLVDFFGDHSFTWRWDPDAARIAFIFASPEIRSAMERARQILSREGLTDPNPTIPVVGHVSAGEGFEYTDGGFAAGEGFDQVDLPPGVPPSLARSLYCVKVRGDSLREFFGDGALLFIKPESWEEIRDGDLVIFKDRRNRKAFVKKVEFAGDSLILKSMNSLYKNMVLKKSDLALLERVTAIVL
jgi:SOS-response transcriptional repressor LexA/transcriptional regulator with XRE-family HTH domain